MGAPRGNQFWKARAKHGRDKIFSSPEILFTACCEYFQWVEDNPLYATEVIKYQGEATTTEVPKMRAMLISGLCIFLDIDQSTWGEYRANKDFTFVVRKVEEIIYTQKFSGAAAELLNANIIARDLGLKDTREDTGKVIHEHTCSDEMKDKLDEIYGKK